MFTMKGIYNRIFVTGGNGFIGSQVVRQLVTSGYTVRCLLRKTSKLDRIQDLPIEKAIGDLRHPDSLLAGMHHCDAIIHLASLSNWDDIGSPRMRSLVVEGTTHVLDAGNQCGQLPMVYVSSAAAINGSLSDTSPFDESSVFSLPQDGLGYAHAKYAAEQVCLAYAQNGYPVTIVNPAEVYGPDDIDFVTARTLIDFATHPITFVPQGGTSIVHVDDVAAGIVAALHRGAVGQRYILASDNLSFQQLAELTHQLLGIRKMILVLPDPMIKLAGWLAGSLNIQLGIAPAQVPYAIRYWYMNNQKAMHALGVTFRPAEAVLKPTLNWLLRTGHLPG